MQPVAAAVVDEQRDMTRIELAQVLLALGDAKPAADALVSATQVEGFSANPVLQIEHAVCFAQLQVAEGRQQDALSALLEAVARAKQIGVLGSGVVAQTLAAGFLKHGYAVKLGSRDTGKLADWH